MQVFGRDVPNFAILSAIWVAAMAAGAIAVPLLMRRDVYYPPTMAGKYEVKDISKGAEFSVSGIQQLWFYDRQLWGLRVDETGIAEILPWKLEYSWVVGKLDVGPSGKGSVEFKGYPNAVAADPSRPVIGWLEERNLYIAPYRAAKTIRVPLSAAPLRLAFLPSGQIALQYENYLEIRNPGGTSVLKSVTLGQYRDQYPILTAGSWVGTLDAQKAQFIRVQSIQGAQNDIWRFDIASDASVFALTEWGEVIYQRSDLSMNSRQTPFQPTFAIKLSAPGQIKVFSGAAQHFAFAAGGFPGIAAMDETGTHLFTPRADNSITLLAADLDNRRLAYATKDTVGMYELEYTVPQYAPGKTVTETPWWPVSAYFIAAGFLPLLVAVAQPRKVVVLPSTPATEPPPAPATPLEEPVPAPVVPEELVTACAARECVLYVGAGLSSRAGTPLWPVFVWSMLEWARTNELIDQAKYERQRRSLEAGELNAVADNLASAFEGRPDLAQQFVRSQTAVQTVPPVHKLIASIPFAAVLTNNYDALLESALGADAIVLTPRDTDALNKAADQRSFYLLKLYGAVERPETIMLSIGTYKAMVDQNARFSRFIESLCFSDSILFVGTSLDSIETFFAPFKVHAGLPRPHFALAPVSGLAWRERAESLERRYRLQVIPFEANRFDLIDKFLEDLKSQVDARRQSTPDASQRRGRFMSVALENIGPFKQLTLSLAGTSDDPEQLGNWLVLLGDNGVGKSTILRALALVVGAEEAKDFAGSLIHVDAQSARVRLTTELSSTGYEVRLDREGERVDLEMIPGEFVKKERTLVLGFGPLRTISRQRPRGPQAPPSGLLSSSDVLPLLRSEPDVRMDRLKQWVVNLYTQARTQESEGRSDNRQRRLLNKFLKVAGEVALGLKIERIRVDENYQVWVKGQDGDIPIESLSQGATALLGWVGVLLQRLYEVYDDPAKPDEDPCKRHAVVLIDEIDAHMHPAWQQGLVQRLQSQFPNVQFVVTTHSPFVVAGMPVERVVRFRRNRRGEVVQVDAAEDTTMGRADQILTGELFGLKTTLDVVTQQKISRYQELLAKRPSERSDQENEEFVALGRELEERIPPTGETPIVRRAQDLVAKVMETETPEELKKKAELLARSLYGEESPK